MIELVTRKAENRPGHWRLLLSRWKLACTIFLVLFAASIAMIERLTPLYKSSVAILLPVMSVEDPGNRRQAPQSQTDAFVVRSYKDVIEDPGICQTVINALHLDQVAEFQPKPGILSIAVAWMQDKMGYRPDSDGPVSKADVRKRLILERYQDRLASKNDAKSLILNLSFKAEDPYLSEKVANAHAQAFIASEIRFRRQSADEKARWMKAELDNAAEEARNAQMVIQLRSVNMSFSRETAASQSAELKALQMVADSKRAVFEEFLTKYRAMIADERYAGSEIRILSPATVPARPAFPQKLLMVGAAAVLSFVLAILLALMIGFIRRRETMTQFADRNEITVVGHVNISGRRRRPWPARHRVARACFWEQIRGIRCSFKKPRRQGMVVAIASALPAEGKSLVAEALARSLAVSGVRTLLLDANPCRPSFYAAGTRTNDLCSYLRGDTKLLQSLVVPNASLPMYLLGASKEKRFGDGDLLMGPRMGVLFKEVRKEFEAIIVDLPAINILPEGHFIAGLADQVLLTTLEGRTPLDAVQNAVNRLRQGGCRLSGMIIGKIGRPERASFAYSQVYRDRVCPPELWPTKTWLPIWKGRPGSAATPATAQMVAECLPVVERIQPATG